MSKKQSGFTLIEIVMVLVLLGILSAVAVPKYFDLQEQALQNAAKATVAEVQSRLNAHFADQLLKGKTCDAALAQAKKNMTTENFGDWTVALESEANGKAPVTLTYGPEKNPVTPDADSNIKYEVTIPTCAAP